MVLARRRPGLMDSSRQHPSVPPDDVPCLARAARDWGILTVNILASLGIYALHILVLPPLLIGFIRLAKARLQNRQGPSLLQSFWDLAKLFGKGETISATTT